MRNKKKIQPYKIICHGGVSYFVRLNKCVRRRLPSTFEVHLLVDESRGIITRTRVKGFKRKVYRCKDRYKIVKNEMAWFWAKFFGVDIPETYNGAIISKSLKILYDKLIIATRKVGKIRRYETMVINQFYVILNAAGDMGSSTMYYKRIS